MGFLTNHIVMLSLAKSEKHSSHSTFIPTKTPVKTKNGHHNISTTGSKGTSNSEVINSQFNTNTDNKTAKIVMLTFGDTKKSQFTIAKPILDQYGF
jgi:hypothetical protein